MFKAIKIVNYQSHKLTIMKFVAGVNVLFGLSQAGKTAVLRAIRWVLTNRPTGFRYHSQFADEPETVVSIYTDDLGTITHRKTATTDIYTLDKHKWGSVNKEVPDMVINALDMNDINIQNQFDSPLLITSSPTEIGKTINKVTGVEKADIWRATLTTRINDLKKEKKILKADVKALDDKLASYEKLTRVGKLIKQIESAQAEIQSYTKELELIESHLESVKEKVRLVRQLTPFQEAVQKLDDKRNQFIEIWREKEAIKDHLALVKQYNKDRLERQQTIDEYTELLRQVGICPTCFVKINDQTIERILHEI